jgi:pyruvate dehydrogenase E2 component (dihydrolipoamide acetyltransferase)
VGIDLKSLRPGPDGVIGISEVAAAIEARRERQPALAHGPPHAPETAPEAGSATGAKPGLDRDAMRRAIGAAMARSKREIPHYYVSSTLDVTAFLKWLEALNAQRSVEARILYAAPLFKAVALALKAAPQLNGTFADGRHNPSAAVHVGVATALRGGGLIAPALHDTGGLALDEAMSRLRDIVSRVRTGRIRSSEMTDATVTLSMLGDDTADTVQPVIYPPQVAIIGCGAIRERPWVVEGAIVPRRVINVTVAGDHRVSDGRVAARFLKRLEALLGDPAQLEETDKP